MALLYDWKDMSTAPKDGTCIWGYCKDINDLVVCYYDSKRPDYGWQHHSGLINLNIIRWCHLPKDLADKYKD